MWDLKYLQSKGGTEEELRKKFEPKDGKLDLKIEQLIELIWQRTETGIRISKSNTRLFWAIDQAFDAPQQQITNTLVRGLVSSNLSGEQILSAVKEFKLDYMLTDYVNEKGETGKKLDLPTFFKMFVPTVFAYAKTRWAKLFNDINLVPLYKYEPAVLTMENRIRCEVITSRIQQMTQQLRYLDTEKQSILQMLLYGECLNFPMEDWYRDEQIIEGKKEVIKEGVRWVTPHPSRTFYDRAYSATTLNSDSGCEYSGFWDLRRYRDIKNNPKFWNRETVTMGEGRQIFSDDGWRLLQMLNPCQMTFPNWDMLGSTDGAGDKDRQRQAFDYTKNQDDHAVCVTSHYCKIVPKDWSLFDYEYPVWMRFLLANDRTVLHAIPIGYSPTLYYGYDNDQNRYFNTSLALEALPWQDQMTNLYTQYILSVKQNLNKVVFYDTDQLSTDDIAKIRNLGEKSYREINYIPFSSKERRWDANSQGQAFLVPEMPQIDTAQITAAISNTVSIMERMLGISPQELGAPASHEQSATELAISQKNTTVRLEFTGSGVDAGIETRKRALYEAMMNYSNDEMFVQVADLDDVKKEALKKLGFTVDSEPFGNDSSAGIKGDKKLLRMDGFVSQRDGSDRIQDAKVASTMIQTFQSIFSNPAILQSQGMPQLLNMFNQILVYAGLPKDFRLRLDPHLTEKNAEQNGQQAQEAQQQQAQAIMQQLQQMEQKMAQEILQASGQQTQQIVAQAGQQMAAAMKQQVVDPLEAQSVQLRQALMAIGAKVAQITQHDGQQDQAIAAALTMLKNAAARVTAQPQIQRVPVPVAIPAQAMAPQQQPQPGQMVPA